MCNEIKLAIAYGEIKGQDEIQHHLDQLTEIMEVCGIKSKKVDPNFVSELLGLDKEERRNRHQKVVQKSDSQESDKSTTGRIVSNNAKQKRHPKQKSKNNKKKIYWEKGNLDLISEFLGSNEGECPNRPRKVVTVIQKSGLQEIPGNRRPKKIVSKNAKQQIRQKQTVKNNKRLQQPKPKLIAIK